MAESPRIDLDPITEVPSELGIKMEDIRPEPESPEKTPNEKRRDMRREAGLPPQNTKLKKQLENFYASIGLAVMPFDTTCALAITQNSVPMAESLDNLAKENPAVKRVLERLVTTGAWSQVIMAHVPVALVIARHHVPGVDESMQRLGEKMMGNNDAAA